jgi:hypothetical protein
VVEPPPISGEEAVPPLEHPIGSMQSRAGREEVVPPLEHPIGSIQSSAEFDDSLSIISPTMLCFVSIACLNGQMAGHHPPVSLPEQCRASMGLLCPRPTDGGPAMTPDVSKSLENQGGNEAFIDGLAMAPTRIEVAGDGLTKEGGNETWNSLQIGSPVMGSPLPLFQHLSTPIVPSPATTIQASNLMVYSRRRPARRPQQATADEVGQEVANTLLEMPKNSAQALEDVGVSATPNSVRNAEEATSLPGQLEQPSSRESTSTTITKEEFLTKVISQVSALLPMSNFKELTTKVVPLECTPRRSCRIAKAGVEFQMGDLAGRSTKKAIRSLGTISKNQGIDQQA